MVTRVLLAVSDTQCACAAIRALEPLNGHRAGVVMVLGIVQPFRTVYAHKHPIIGRRIRNLLWQTATAQLAETRQLVCEVATRLRSVGWEVRNQVSEGPVVEVIVRYCRDTCPQILIVGACLVDETALWGRAVWREVVPKVGCPVMVVKHDEIQSSAAYVRLLA